MRLLLFLSLLRAARPAAVDYFGGRWPPRREEPIHPAARDASAFAGQMEREIKEASGLTTDEFEKYKVTLRNLGILGEYKFFGQIRGDLPPPSLNVTDSEVKTISPFLFEGDILLTPDQMKSVVKGAVEDAGLTRDGFRDVMVQNEDILAGSFKNRQKRKMTAQTRLRWRMPVQYRISGASSSAVRAGVALWEANTCVRFQQTSSRSGNYIEFTRGSGCFSSVGMVGGRQVVSIGSGCERIGIVAHEIGHALGFWHEQSRPDRDQWVTINERNIVSGTLGNFLPRSRSDVVYFGIPYDLGSVMHYGPTAFARSSGVQTITARDPNFQTTMGQREGLSFSDVKFINSAYCEGVCPRPLACKHSGYADPKNCNRCRCPDGLGGQLCDRAEATATACGTNNLQTRLDWQTVSKRGSGKCAYHIVAPPGKRIIIQILDFGFAGRRETCSTKYLELKYSRDLGTTGARLCTTQPRQSFTSESAEAIILYVGDSNSAITLRFRQDSAGPQPVTRPATPAPVTRPVTRPTPPTFPTRPVTRPTAPTFRPFTPRPTQPPRPTPSPCVIPGGWLSWGSWERCTESCGGCGTQSRRRQCSPGARCRGLPTESRPCNFRVCSGNRQPCCTPYMDTGLSFCGIGTGELTTERPIFRTTAAPGPSTFGPWSPWNVCSGAKQCGGCGSQIRSRTCQGRNCVGATIERRACAFEACSCTQGRIIGWVACPGDRSRLCPLRRNSDHCEECCRPFELDRSGQRCE